MSVEIPSSSPPQPPRSKGTLVIIVGGLALVAFFIGINLLDSKPSSTPVKAGRPPTGAPLPAAGTPTAKFKPLPQGTLSAPLPFTSLQGYKLTVAPGWRVLPLHGPLDTDLILQTPESSTTASIFTITVADASKSLPRDPILDLPGPEVLKGFTPLPPKRIKLDGAPAAEQEGTLIAKGKPAHVLQVFASHDKRAYNFTIVCPQAQFKKRLPDLQQMLDSLKWIPAKQPAPPNPKL